MSTVQDDAPNDAPHAPAGRPAESAPYITHAVRRSGRLGTRVLAVLSLIVALGVTGYVVASALEPSAPAPLVAETAGAWEATSALSDSLRELRPGASRRAARALAKRAAEEVGPAGTRVLALNLPTSATPLRSRVRAALRADLSWIKAVDATLADPRSPSRADLARLAKRAAQGVSLIAGDVPAAKRSVGGTGRLLSATKPA